MSRFTNVQVSRPDWGWGSTTLSNDTNLSEYNNVTIVRPGSHLCCQLGGSYPAWNISSASATVYSGATQDNKGTVPVVWSVGGTGGGTRANDVEIGGQMDPGAGTTASRNILPVGGLLGPPTPVGTNQNAGTYTGWSPFGSNCGLSTGSGTPGTCNWYVGTTGSSGTQVNPGTIAMTLSPTNGLTSTLGFNGSIGGTTPEAGTFTTVNASSQINLGQTVVGSLPPASTNPGGMWFVTDSTAVSAEGQTCAGSSSSKAIAISNGTVWKCF